MKKLSVILLALLLTLFCAACGNDENTDKDKDETGKVTTTVTDSAEPDVGDDADETEDEGPYDEDDNDWEGEDCDDEDHHPSREDDGTEYSEFDENGELTICVICGEEMPASAALDHQRDVHEGEEYDTFDENEEVICFDCDMIMAVGDWQAHLNAFHGGSEWVECPYCGLEYSISEEDHGECTEEGA